MLKPSDRNRAAAVLRIWLCSIVLLFVASALAQNYPFTNSSVGFSASTNGLGLFSRTLITQKDDAKNHSIRFGLQMLRHHKEAKVQNTKYTAPKPYVFDKANNGVTARFGYGYRKTFSKKAIEKPLLSIVFAGGPNVGFLKPYYIRLENPDDDQNNILIVRQTEDTRKHQENIVGPANWTRGLNEIETQLGIHASVSLDMEWIHSYSFKSWEVGAQIDYFFDDFYILNSQPSNSFVGLFTHYTFGKN